ncbi:hypothetical protein HNR23_002242 [Nocardiopsis mwathae]|uniref:Uncharacterized protein n=1 Tax=Nocardiopsis mwathae TaxID=1472723 RepID=A0A7W9YHF0_9ACTN|nr:hypothetical protein [Nocardiopsis mwathae]MBB6172182.1 hypothetical protein [Nocardiopsis mwathae]
MLKSAKKSASAILATASMATVALIATAPAAAAHNGPITVASGLSEKRCNTLQGIYTRFEPRYKFGCVRTFPDYKLVRFAK